MIALPRFTRSALSALAMTCLIGAAEAQTVTVSAPGADDDLVDRIRATSLLVRSLEEETPPTSQDVIAAARADYGRIIAALYDQGYFAPVIRIQLDGREAAAVSPFATIPPVQNAQITVQTGPAFQLGRATVSPLADNTVMPPRFRTGETATTPLLRAATEAALAGWRDRGHAVAEVSEQRITAQNREAILDVAISIAPGPVVRFGNLNIIGDERMRRERIIEIAGLPTGDIYSPAALARAEERLQETGVFSAAALTLGDVDPGNVADVTATLAEAPLRRLGFGAELSSDDGLQLTAYWIHRNLFGGAERLRLDGEISGIRNTTSNPDAFLEGTLTRPATFTPDTELELGFRIFAVDEPTFQALGGGLGARLTDRVTESLTIFGGVEGVYYRVSDGFGDRDIVRLSLPLGATFDNRDEPLDPRAGAYAEVEVTPFFPVGSDLGLYNTLDLRGYYGFGDDRRTRVAGRVQLGTVVGSNIRDIPPEDFFFSGGSGTVRGQSYQSLGAVQNGTNAGGRSFAGLSLEVRHDFMDSNLGIVGFADTGFISTDALWDGPSDWHAGAGFGVRYSTPFGPVRVDLATPVRGPGVGEDLFLYIGIGHAF